ncbi:WD40-repeat-containing domain protein [Gaertneriomyces semiglobifer]|nr:WD40-repeat-containing domain protein [Gaertneriomyces semiglobifer]
MAGAKRLRAHTVQILWHDKQPVYSVDFEAKGGQGRFATGGGDHNVRIWRLASPNENDDQETPRRVEYLATLSRHNGAVNCVRWHPFLPILASGGDDGTIFIWTQVESQPASTTPSKASSLIDSSDDPETWRPTVHLRGATSDLYDLCWSPDGKHILSACVDNSVRVFNVAEKKCVGVLNDHGHYVQGVAWDPRGKWVVTQSSDRSVSLYQCVYKKNQLVPKLETRLRRLRHSAPPTIASAPPTTTAAMSSTAIAANQTADTPSEPSTIPAQPKQKLTRAYHDETLTSFFRRLTFTPDGLLLICPAGVYHNPYSDTQEEPQNAAHIYTRASITGYPVVTLPGHDKPSVAVRCNPVAYKHRTPTVPKSNASNSNNPTSSSSTNTKLFALPYRHLYALCTSSSLYIYDTSHPTPIGYCGGLHYATLTDVAWSRCGNVCLVTSTDGFVSMVEVPGGEVYDGVIESSVECGMDEKENRSGQGDAMNLPSTILATTGGSTPIATTATLPSTQPQQNKTKKRITPQLISPITSLSPSLSSAAPSTSSTTPSGWSIGVPQPASNSQHGSIHVDTNTSSSGDTKRDRDEVQAPVKSGQPETEGQANRDNSNLPKKRRITPTFLGVHI